MIKTIAYISIIPVLIAVFFFDNIKGYYRFKELCAEHKELVVYQKLERDLGWQVDTEEPTVRSGIYEILYFIPTIKFFRFQDYADHKIYDAFFIGANRIPYEKFDWHVVHRASNDENNFSLSLINENKPIYQLEHFSEDIPNETRISRAGYRIRDLRTNKIAVSLEEIGYSTFDRNHTLLDAPSGNICRFAPSLISKQVNAQIF